MDPIETPDHEALIIEADDIGEDGLAIERALARDFVDEMLGEAVQPRWAPAADGGVALRLTREAGTVRVRGRGEFSLQHECVRCLRAVGFGLQIEVDVVLQKGASTGLDGEVAVGQGDRYWEEESVDLLASADVVPFDGKIVDVASLVREQIFLEVPAHPACDVVGAQPPEGPCELDPDGALTRERERWVDPRFAGLAALRDSLPPGPSSEN
jgi:uncharacterized metal-binding protein YceD (DUF177 family)